MWRALRMPAARTARGQGRTSRIEPACEAAGFGVSSRLPFIVATTLRVSTTCRSTTRRASGLTRGGRAPRSPGAGHVGEREVEHEGCRTLFRLSAAEGFWGGVSFGLKGSASKVTNVAATHRMGSRVRLARAPQTRCAWR